MSAVTEEAAFMKLAAWCSTSEHCESEAIDKLMKWGVDLPAQKRILARLKQEKFVNNERYCQAFVRDKFRFQKWGRRKIKEALLLKKMSYAAIEEALSGIDAGEYEETLKAILKTKKRSLHEADAYREKVKLFRFAASRGFESALISRFLDFDEAAAMD